VEIAFRSGGRTAGGIVEEYADAGQRGATGGVRDNTGEGVAGLLRLQADSLQDEGGEYENFCFNRD